MCRGRLPIDTRGMDGQGRTLVLVACLWTSLRNQIGRCWKQDPGLDLLLMSHFAACLLSHKIRGGCLGGGSEFERPLPPFSFSACSPQSLPCHFGTQ